MKKEPILLDNSNLKGNEIYFVRSKINKYYPLHFHEYYEIELPISGSGYELINGNKYEIKKNQIFIFHPSDYHEIIATTPITMFNLAFTYEHVDEKVMTNFLEYRSEIVSTLSELDLKIVTSLLEQIESLFFSNKQNKENILSYLLNSLLLITIESNNDINLSDKITIDILKYIHKNFKKNPSLSDLSKFSGYQKNYLCDYFKRNIGETYNEYLTKTKIEYSKKLLKNTSKSIKEISSESGFNSVNNYIRNFKSKTKQTPLEYRILYLKTKIPH